MKEAVAAKKNNGGFGVGSASIVLIFAVLCLTVFTLITYITAGNHKALIDTEAEMVSAYYSADTLAEVILDLLLTTGARSGNYLDVEINKAYNEAAGAETTYYFCPINESKSLYVNILFAEDTYSILSWRTIDTSQWNADGGVNVWSGE